MKYSVLLLIVLLAFVLGSQARTAHRSSHSSPDPMYSSALAAANRFLHAWQNQDHEVGILMLADSGRQNASPESLQSFFTPGPNAAYEIAHGRRLKPGEYEFPLVLFGSSGDQRPRVCKLIVAQAGKTDWAVEKLP